MLNQFIDHKLTVFYSDGSKLLSHTGVLIQFDAKCGMIRLTSNHKDILFPIQSIAKIELFELEQPTISDPEPEECYEHRGHDFW